MAAVDPTHERDKPTTLDHRIISEAQLLSVMFEERLHLVHSYYIPAPAISGALSGRIAESWPIDEQVSREIRNRHSEAFERLAAEIGFPADQIHLCQGDPMVVLPEMAEELNADMVVMGAVSRSRPERVMVGSTAERTLDHFSCDVVVVKPEHFVSRLTLDHESHGFMIKTGPSP